jgi:hypothetical protein
MQTTLVFRRPDDFSGGWLMGRVDASRTPPSSEPAFGRSA